jgi:inner membrane protein
MASFGHLAVGLVAGRFHAQGRVRPAQPRTCAVAMMAFGLLGLLPDADVLLVNLGCADASVIGHRGASHSLLTAVLIAVVGGLMARRYGWNGLRTALAIMLAVGSHGIIDSFGQGGRAIPLLWPFSAHRFSAPWRCLPDAPRGLLFLSRDGFFGAALEFLYFLPMTAYALWPRRKVGAPALAIVEGGGGKPVAKPAAPRPGAALAASSSTARHEMDDPDREEPSLRSIG